jgi:hypothetical protein
MMANVRNVVKIVKHVKITLKIVQVAVMINI